MRTTGLTLLAGLMAAAFPLVVAAQDVPLTNRDLNAITVSPASGVATIMFTADPSLNGEDLFDIVSSDPGVVATLVLPSGMEISASNADSLGFSYQTLAAPTFGNGLVPSAIAVPGTHTLIRLPGNSTPGAYTVKLDPSGASGNTLVIASYYSSSAVLAGLVSGKSSYQVGENVVFSGILYESSTPVTGATATLSVSDSANVSAPPVQVAMTDSGPFHAATGDGIYLGVFTPTAPGHFTAAMRVNGTSSSGVPFSRLASTAFRVLPQLANFTSFEDEAVDDNGDGIIDRVVVTAHVNVQTAGKYQFGIALASSSGAVIKSSTVTALNSGDTRIAASFAPAAFSSLGVNGPYARTDAVLVYLDDPENPGTDVQSDAGASAAYDLNSLTGAGLNSITADAGALQFGNVPNGSSKDMTLTVHNRGPFPLMESTLVVTNPSFTVVAPSCPFILTAGADQVLTVRFTPAGSSAQTGTLTVAGIAVALSGTGVAGSAVLNASPGSLDFGVVAPGQTKDLTVSISNSGTIQTQVTATGASGLFSVQPATFTLNPGAQQPVDIRFAPKDSTPQTAKVVFQGNDPSGSSTSVTLKGNSAAPGPDLTVSLTSLDFGSVTANQTQDLTLTLSNAGGAAIGVTAASTSNPRFLIMAPAVPFSVAGGASQTVTVRFAPVAIGSQTGTLTLVTAAGPLSVDLKGSSADIELKVDSGVFHRAIGFPTGSPTAYFVNRLTPPFYPATLEALRIIFQNRSDGLPLGAPVQILIGGNPGGSSQLSVSGMESGPSAVAALDAFVTYSLSSPLTINSGDFIVGFSVVNPPGDYPAEEDVDSPSQGRSYFSTDGSSYYPLDSYGPSLAGNLGIRAVVKPASPTH